MKIHLIGIGGIGVSALAQYYLSKGYKVSGSDLVTSEITDFLRKKGIKIFIGNSAKNISRDFDLVVFSPAVKKDNPELLKAKSYNLKAISYPEALAEISKDYYTIAVAGAHGKSTTTAMIALSLTKAELDPTVIVGTKIREFNNSNFRFGKSKILVIEACEYDSSFLHYSPNIIVVTNIDKEHLDYFKTLANVKKAFHDFIMRLPKDGFLVFNNDDKYKPKIKNPEFKIRSYSLKQKEAKTLGKTLKVPGKHNVSNALAVLQVSRILGIPDKTCFQALSEFTGTWRRFEIFEKKMKKPNKLKAIRYTLVSDYGHHPNEILATLRSAREKYPHKKIWCVFQPHQHQRTFYLFKDFVKVFREVPIDQIIITDIYDVAGREILTSSRTHDRIGAKIKEVSSKKLVEAASQQNIIYLALEDIERFVKKNISAGDVLIIMGAGDIYQLADKF